MKLKQRVLESPSGSILDGLSEVESQYSEFEGEAKLKEDKKRMASCLQL